MSFAALASHLRALTPAAIEAFLGRGNVVRRAQQYFADDRVEQLWADGTALRAAVSGTQSSPYLVVFRLYSGELEPQCSCPYAHGVCWHAGAVLFSIVADPARLDAVAEESLAAAQAIAVAPVAPDPSAPPASANAPAAPAGPAGPGGPAAPVSANAPAAPVAPGLLRAPAVPVAPAAPAPTFADRLLAWPKRRLAATLAALAEQDAVVRARIFDEEESEPETDLRLYRQAARAALRPGQRVRRHDAPRVAEDLREIAAAVQRLPAGPGAVAALDLLEEIAGRGLRRLDDADDRDGALAAAVRDVLHAWARGWAAVPGRDRQRLAREVFGWLVEDDGGLTAGLVGAAHEALGPAGLAALAALLRPLAAAGPAADPAAPAPRGARAERVRAALREIAEARSDLDEFLRFCDADAGSARELAAAAARLAREGRHAEALRWVERGLERARGTVRADLAERRLALLVRLDRRREAIEAAWDAFVAEPGEPALRRLLGVAGEPDRAEWRRRALDQAEAGADATAFVEVTVAAGDLERLERRLENAPGFVLAAGAPALRAAAAALEEARPAAAARLLLQVAHRRLGDGDPRHHGEARDLLEQAAAVARSGGADAWWRAALERLREAHAVVRTWYP